MINYIINLAYDNNLRSIVRNPLTNVNIFEYLSETIIVNINENISISNNIFLKEWVSISKEINAMDSSVSIDR